MKFLLVILSLFWQLPAFPPGERGIVTGQIRSSDGEPLPGISVFAVVGGVQDGRVQVTPIGVSIPGTVAQTNAEGQYRLTNIPPGRYYILAQVPAPSSNARNSTGGEQIHIPTLYPGVSSLDAATRLDIRPGSEINRIDFSIVRGRAMKLRGRVLDATTGGPSPQAAVNLTGSLLGSVRTFTDENGAYEFPAVAEGDYVLWARGKAAGVREPFATRRISVHADTDGVDLTFRPGVIVAGRLTLEDGRAFTNPRGLPGITANIVERTFGTGTSVLMDGTFRLGGPSGLVDGEYRISVDHVPGDYYVKSIKLGSTDLLKETLKIAGPALEEMAITLGVGTRIDGNIVDEHQQPVANARVYLIPQSGGATHLAKTEQAGNNGDFVVRGVAAGTYAIFAVARSLPGAERDPDFIREYEARGRIISVSKDPVAALSLRLLR